MVKALSFKGLDCISTTRIAELKQFGQDAKFRMLIIFSRENVVFH